MRVAGLRTFAKGILAAGFAAVLPSQGAVRLVRVPDVIVLPASPGQNLVVEAETTPPHGGVWLFGLEGVAPVRFAEAGPGRWQCNLADPAVARLLGDGPRGQLFAGPMLPRPESMSAPIEWTRVAPPPLGLSCRAHLRGAASVLASVHGVEHVEADRLAELEVALGTATGAAVRLRCAGDEVAFAPVANEPRLRLAVDEGLRARIVASGAFAVEVDLPAGRHVFRFAIAPTQLDPAQLGKRFSVMQRMSATVPGSREFLAVALGDITFGETQLVVRGPGRDLFAPPRPVFQGDWVEFSLANGSYVLVVDRLVNAVFGEDHAELRVVAAADFAPDPVAVLIRRVAASPDTFVRAGVESSGGATARVLASQCAAEHVRGLSLDRFVDEVASRSRKDGSEHRVRRTDGTEVSMRDWLRAELEAYEVEKAKKR